MVQKIIPFNVEIKSTSPRKWVSVIPECFTNDLRSVNIQFTVSDCTALELETATAYVYIYAADGSFFQNPSTDVDRTGNVFTYTLKENEGNHKGIAEAQLVMVIDGKELASQLQEFKIINGLEAKVAQEVMIYDWTVLKAEAQSYINQFVLDEADRATLFATNQLTRQNTFDDAEAARVLAFTTAQNERAAAFSLVAGENVTAFGAAQTQRQNDFNAAEAARVSAFNVAEAGRAEGYDADHSRAGTDHTTALNDSSLAATARTNAATDRTNAATDRNLAATDHTTASGDHTQALVNNATVAGFNTRLTAEETATAANKISAVKAKTFADVDARLEDVEFDTTIMGTNLVTNGDFSNGSTGWLVSGSTSVVNGRMMCIVNSQWGVLGQFVQTITNHKYYFSLDVEGTSASQYIEALGGYTKQLVPNVRFVNSVILTEVSGANRIFKVVDGRASNWTPFYMGNMTVIDLTATFGAGNEPTVEQMDGIMAKFPNSWFDGTKNLFQAKASLNKLMALDARTEFEMRNEVDSKGVSGWSYVTATPTVVGNEVTMVTTGGYARLDINTTGHTVNDKIYTRVTKSTPVESTGYTAISIATPNEVPLGTPPKDGMYYTYSGIHTLTGSGHTVRVYMNDTVSGLNHRIKNVSVINLTKTFGAGKEPTLVEMDRLMARFPNSWFDGVKPIQTIETLYQEKANKAQEAWITPTLLNGWVNGSQAIKYRKDTVGNVHIEGTVKNGSGTFTQVFLLPVGYRPLDSRYIPAMSSYSLGVFNIDPSGSVSFAIGTTTNENRICATFSTE